MKHWVRFAPMACLAALATCSNEGIGSVGGGDCKIVHVPQYAVLGKTGYDQGWINSTTEAIVVGCGQDRPKARPASLDAPKGKAAPKAKPKGWIRRHIGV